MQSQQPAPRICHLVRAVWRHDWLDRSMPKEEAGELAVVVDATAVGATEPAAAAAGDA